MRKVAVMSRSTFLMLLVVAAGWGFTRQSMAQTQGKAGDNAIARGQEPLPESRMPGTARGFRMRLDGMTEGRVGTVDPSTLDLVPLPNAIISFMQNRRFIAQGRSNAEGRFAVRGLTPWAVYSVYVSTSAYVGVTAAPVYPDAPAAPAAGVPAGGAPADAATTAGHPARHLVAALLANGDYLEVQLVPRDDFLTALQSGVMGDGTGGAGAGAVVGGGGTTGSGVGGGGGGGAGGFGGLGGALGAAAAIGFAAGASEGENQPSSSFAP
jgi:hypothetical protein